MRLRTKILTILNTMILCLLVSVSSLDAHNLCQPAFEIEGSYGTMISFRNSMIGDCDNIIWNFGDGHISDEFHPTHNYQQIGDYNVCLSVWDKTTTRTEYCQLVSVGLESNTCVDDDCVYPGDANQDGIANNYDLLSIGLSYGQTGSARPNASTLWTQQNAPNWHQYTPNTQIDLKHTDCDGNGIINEDDIIAIHNNFQSVPVAGTNSSSDDSKMERVSSNANIHIEFEEVQGNLFNNARTISANVYLAGHNAVDLEDLYGIAFSIHYPSNAIGPTDVITQYQGTNWFAPDNKLLKVELQSETEGRLDYAYVRFDQVSITGQGRIASINFTIRDDIIGRGNTNFQLRVDNVKAIKADGTPIDFNGNVASITIRSEDETAGNKNLGNTTTILVYPNPAKELLNLEVTNIDVESITMYNTLGQIVLQQAITESKTVLSTKDFESGYYIIQMQTEKGIIIKQVIVE